MHSEAYILGLQRMRAFQALEASQHELTQKNSELLLLNEKLEQATRFKAEFFANVSHEIRTPLNGVLGMAEILSDTNLNTHQRDLVEVIRTSGETLLYVINDILDMSKIESGKLDLELIPFVLRDAVDQVMDLLAPVAFAKGLEISAWIDPLIASSVVGDITRVRQVLLNLLNNAIKFTSCGEVYLELEPALVDQSMIHFLVGDTGIGIPSEKIDRLFRSFSQVDASTNRRYGGTGLGLAICRNLTALMGGRIWVESIFGKGTQFHFDISLPGTDFAKSGHGSRDFRGKRAVAQVRNTRLIRLLATWAEENDLKLVVQSDQAESLESTDYLIIDADHFEIQIPQFNQTKVILLTRSKNISELTNSYPNATVLSLPLKKQRFLQALERFADADSPTCSAATEADPMLSGLNVLVVDDYVVDRRVCVAQLQKLGVLAVFEAENGHQAIEAAQKQAFDLILMDVQMPVIDGLQATRQIRLSASDSNHPRIVALTADALSEARARSLEAGMDDQLIKPAGIDELKAVLQESIKIESPAATCLRIGL